MINYYDGNKIESTQVEKLLNEALEQISHFIN